MSEERKPHQPYCSFISGEEMDRIIAEATPPPTLPPSITYKDLYFGQIPVKGENDPITHEEIGLFPSRTYSFMSFTPATRWQRLKSWVRWSVFWRFQHAAHVLIHGECE